MAETEGAPKCRIVRWRILQGGRLLVEKTSRALPGQNIGGILKIELARLSKMYKNLGFPANLTSGVVSEEEVKEFAGLIVDRRCPEHPKVTALSKEFDPEDYSFCGICGQATEWVLLEKL
ncbi:hypothetical protein KJ969_04165 [Patescibacteria group bacterium]|nr:hypothetical protein [Patescibacteria group bacterium]MBU1921984.1 hypothetical protein [Patescibacteria group bacterium]